MSYSRSATSVKLVLVILLGICSLGCTPQSHSKLPPDWSTIASPQHQHKIIVSTDFWHSMIGFWRGIPESQDFDISEIEEWGYANRDYYLYGDQGLAGSFRALFLESAGVLHRAKYGQPWHARSKSKPTKHFIFWISPSANETLINSIETRRDGAVPILSQPHEAWYAAKDAYSMMYNCHDWTIEVLQAAGLPIQSDPVTITAMLDDKLEAFLGQ